MSRTIRSKSPRRPARKQPRWARYTDEQLLDLRFCDLRLSLKQSTIAAQIERLYCELAARGLQFRPHVWLAEEWFSPDGVPGFAVPFYLAHPRLLRLQRKMMREVEGGNRNWLLRILRHEAGHALDTAYRLRRRKQWRRTFGKASKPYPTKYRPHPASNKFVLHLGHWYAQTHPTEDFAETFAVWLQPRSRWRRQYAQWPALNKLLYVDQLLRNLPPKAAIRQRVTVEPLAENTRTLREHYRRQRARCAVDASGKYDRRLLRVFANSAPHARSAAALLRHERARLTRALTRDARIHAYLVHNVMRAVIDRCRTLKLTVRTPVRDCRRRAGRLVERIVFDTMYRSRQQYTL
jgi:hypothetical protein